MDTTKQRTSPWIPLGCISGRAEKNDSYVKYLGVIFDKRITWRLHIEMIEAKAFKTFIRIYFLLKSERLSANIKLTLHKAMIRSYDCPAWDVYLLKLQRKQNKVLQTTGNFPGAHRSAICTQLSTFRMYTIKYKNCAGNKLKSYKIMRMNMFAV
jgi:hypothetical protein